MGANVIGVGLIANSYASVRVYVNGGTNIQARASGGGLVGNNRADITSSYSASRVCIGGAGAASEILGGGLVGDNTGDIQKSYAIGDVSANTSNTAAYVGGLAGRNSARISGTYATGVLTNTSTGSSGGLVGILGGTGMVICNSVWDYQANGLGMGGAMACALLIGTGACECAAGTPGGRDPAEFTTSQLQNLINASDSLGIPGFSFGGSSYPRVRECTLCTGPTKTLSFSTDEVPGQTGLVKLNAVCP